MSCERSCDGVSVVVACTVAPQEDNRRVNNSRFLNRMGSIETTVEGFTMAFGLWCKLSSLL